MLGGSHFPELLAPGRRNIHPDKVTRADYPLLSNRQLKVRYKRELADEFIERKTGSVNPPKSLRDMTAYKKD